VVEVVGVSVVTPTAQALPGCRTTTVSIAIWNLPLRRPDATGRVRAPSVGTIMP